MAGARSERPAVPETAMLAIKRVTKEEFGPTCYEVRAEEAGGIGGN